MGVRIAGGPIVRRPGFIIVRVAVSRERRGVEDGVSEQDELNWEGVRGAVVRVTAVGDLRVVGQLDERLASAGLTYSRLDDVPRASPRPWGHEAVEVRLRRARVSSRSIHTWSRASAAIVDPGSSGLLPQLSVS